MRQLVNAPNVDTPTADYPKGRVRNKVGATIGTTYTEELVGDLYQLFQKLVVDASITENDLPDNVTNGYQLLDALNAKIKEQTKSDNIVLTIYNAVLNSGSVTIAAQTYDRMIYAYTGGTVTGFDARGEINGTQVVRLNEIDSVSFLLPAGEAGAIEHNSGTATVVVRSVQLGQ